MGCNYYGGYNNTRYSMKNSFSTFDIVKASNETKNPIPRERLRDWIQRGFTPPTTPAGGAGRAAIFTRLDVYGIFLFNVLLRRGFNRKFAAELIKHLKSYVDISAKKNSIKLDFPSTLVFFMKENGKKIISFIPIYAGEHQIKLPSGKMQSISPAGIKDYVKLDGTPGKDIDDWDQIEVVNFIKIRAEIDAALEII